MFGGTWSEVGGHRLNAAYTLRRDHADIGGYT